MAGVLKLRGERNRQAKVVWSEEVVDNEGMGRKKSKSTFDSSMDISRLVMDRNVLSLPMDR